MEIKIKDFNCIKNLTINLQPGLNIIQGPSNSGKSSILKAIENCIFNQSGTTNVRQGCDNYSVGIKYKDHTVSLVKGKDTKYKIDDIVYEKIGVNQLAEVAEALNIRETVLGGEKVRLNFSKQLTYPFLLDKTPGQLYRFIVDSSESESLSNVLKDINKDIKEVDKAIIQNEAQIDILTKQQIQLNESLKNADKILEVSNNILELDTECNSINELLVCYSKYSNLSTDIINLKYSYNKLNINIDTDNLDLLKEDYDKIHQLADRHNKIFNEVFLLTHKINNYSININIEELDDLLSVYNKTMNLYNNYNEIKSYKESLIKNIDSYDKALKENQNILSTYKVCPLCGNSLNVCKD